MKLQDKIIDLRKRRGYSQEELADRLDVSRQAVSKWESGTSVPDLSRIIAMSELFGVSTDYLLKEDIAPLAQSPAEPRPEPMPSEPPCRTLPLDEAGDYLALRKKAARRIAIGAMLCVLSPIPLFLLGALGEFGMLGLTEDVGGILGLCLLFPIVAVAVVLFVQTGIQGAPFAFLEKESFSLTPDAADMVRRTKEGLRPRYGVTNAVGACLCVLSPLTLFIGALLTTEKENDLLMACLLSLMIVIVAVAVYLFVSVGVKWASCQRLLQEGEFSGDKSKNALQEAILSLFWLAVVGAYLAWSFLSGDWHITWIVWPIAGCLSEVLSILLRSGRKNKKQ